MARRLLLAALVAALGASFALTGAALYARGEIEDRAAFTTRATSVLADDDVRAVVASRIVDGVVSGGTPDVLAVRPLVSSLAASVVETSTFGRAFALAVADAHDALVGDRGSVVVEVNRAVPVLLDAIRGVSPQIAAAVPAVEQPVLRLDRADLRRVGASPLTGLARRRWVLALITVLLVGAVIAVSATTRQVLERVGYAALGAGSVIVVALTAAKTVVTQRAGSVAGVEDERVRAAVGAVWTAMVGDLRTAGAVGALAGAVLVVAAQAGRVQAARAAVGGGIRRAWRSPIPVARFARGGVLVAAGVAVLVEPTAFLLVAAGLAGAVLVLAGVAELMGPAPAPAPSPTTDRVGPLRRVGVIGGAIAALAVAVLVIVQPPGAEVEAAAQTTRGCNGSPALCDRRLDEVVFPATHNSYAAADEPGWLFANQRFGIERQLRDGITGLLLDVHYGAPDPESGRVRTDIDKEGTTRNKVALELSPEALRTADRLAGRVGFGRLGGPSRLYLCHTLCELGAEPLDEQLAVIRRHLDADPGAVLILFVEPYVGVPELEREFERAGLLQEAAPLRPGAPLPTLGELVDAGTRLVVLAEEDGGERPWYLDGFAFAQDTPLGATEASELRCTRFRGTADSPLLLVNHWIDTFPPSPRRNDAIAGDGLRARLERCERSRGLPNLVAVDFHDRSGVVDIAAEINARRP